MSQVEVYTHDIGSIAIDNRVEISSTSSDHLNGQMGTVTNISSGKHGTEVKVLLDNCVETWIDIEDVVVL